MGTIFLFFLLNGLVSSKCMLVKIFVIVMLLFIMVLLLSAIDILNIKFEYFLSFTKDIINNNIEFI